jgi:hypothetical protein
VNKSEELISSIEIFSKIYRWHFFIFI